MKVKQYKALARQSLIGRYGTIIVAAILAGLLECAAFALSIAGLFGAILCSGHLDAVLQSMDSWSKQIPGMEAQISVSGSGTMLSFPLTIAGISLFVIGLLLYIVLGLWFRMGQQKLLLRICRGEKCGVGTIFYAFSAEAHPFRVIFTFIAKWFIMALVHVLGVVGYFILIGYGRNIGTPTPDTMRVVYIAAIVIFILILLNVFLGFYFAELAIIDRPETTIGSALAHSRKVTKGRKIQMLWMMTFSFLFWFVLMSICRLTSIWIIPYIRCAFVVLYLDGDGSAWQIPATHPEVPVTTAPETPRPEPTLSAPAAAQPVPDPVPAAESLQPASEAEMTSVPEAAADVPPAPDAGSADA